MFKGLPSKERLRELRSKGRVSLSSFATRAATVAAVFLAILAIGDQLARISQRPFELDLGVKRAASELLGVGGALRVVVITSVAAVLAVVLTTILQTRFAFGWPVLRHQLGRRAQRTRPVRTVLLLILMGLISLVMVRFLAHDLLLVTRLSDAESISKALAAVLGRLCKLVVVAGGVLAIIGSLVSRLGFILKRAVKVGQNGAAG
jgi:flagellar biosynthesis protein FlhB